MEIDPLSQREKQSPRYGRMGYCFREGSDPQEKFTPDGLSLRSIDDIWWT
jgi:hypothetical protein